MKAAVLRSQGDFDKAVSSLEQALSVCKLYGFQHRRRMSLMRMGLLHWDLGNMPESSRYFGEAMVAYKDAGDLREAQFCRTCLELVHLCEQGKMDRRSKLYYASLRKFDEAIALGRSTGFPDFELKCLRQKSLVFWETDRLDLFLLMSQQGLKISEAIHHDIERGRCLNNIGIAYHRRNEFSLAVEHLESALACVRESGDTDTEAECLSNIGILYRDLGNYSRALHCLTQAIAIDLKRGDEASVSADLGNIGTVFLRKGLAARDKQDLRQGLEALRKSLQLARSGAGGPASNLPAINNIGIILNELGRHQEARDCFESVLNEAGGRLSVLEKGHLLNNIAASYLSEHRIGEARRLYERSYRTGIEKTLEDVVIGASFGLGQCCELEHSYAEALDFYQRSASALENIRDRLSSEILTIGFERDKLGVYQNIIDLLTSEYQAAPSRELIERVFNTVERAKARAFLENVRRANADNAPSDPHRIRERLTALSRNIKELEKSLARPGLPQAEKSLIDAELGHEEDEFLRLIYALKESRPAGMEGASRSVCGVQDIQRQVLDDRTMLLEYDLGEKRSLLLLIGASSVDLFVLPGRAEIERSLRAYLKMVSERPADGGNGYKASKRIAQELLPFLERKDLRGVTRLIVVPDGILHCLPFETLRFDSSGGTRCLIEDFALSYCPSASSLLTLKNASKRGPREKDLLFVGAPVYAGRRVQATGSVPGEDAGGAILDGGRGAVLPPLPFSGEEAWEVAKMFSKSRVRVLLGKAASKDAVKGIPLEEFKIIHLACHGLLDEAHPYRSALALSPNDDRDNDGSLRMREIYELTTNADMVVLSACHTAWGPLELAEGPMGLARPFFFTGARSVLASLWTVNDKAAVLFMREFYRHLRAGKVSTEALRLAKLRFLEGSRNHPFFWAGFVLIGDHEVTVSGQ
ncbi:MAG TPA: CHAT domain-containing protein [Candidatus Aminicenantes bacterium]|nr:CHAT domain-containing protein [Candidatus Aminicenantes bacterium]